jgi:hypothetical protein
MAEGDSMIERTKFGRPKCPHQVCTGYCGESAESPRRKQWILDGRPTVDATCERCGAVVVFAGAHSCPVRT